MCAMIKACICWSSRPRHCACLVHSRQSKKPELLGLFQWIWISIGLYTNLFQRTRRVARSSGQYESHVVFLLKIQVMLNPEVRKAHEASHPEARRSLQINLYHDDHPAKIGGNFKIGLSGASLRAPSSRRQRPSNALSSASQPDRVRPVRRISEHVDNYCVQSSPVWISRQ